MSAPREDLITHLYVDSILRTGIVSDNLTSAKSNSELVRSLQGLLESSLACPKHPSQPVASTSATSTDEIFDGTPSLTQPRPQDLECESTPSWSYRQLPDGGPANLTIPAHQSIRQEPAVAFPETREALDVTAKFFYLPPSDYATPSSSQTSSPTSAESKNGTASMYESLNPAWIQDSLEQLRIATGLNEVNTFVISFPGLTFDESVIDECCDDKNARFMHALSAASNASKSARSNGDTSSHDSNGSGQNPAEGAIRENVLKVWKAASANTHLLSLGVSEFSLARLRWLLDEAKRESDSKTEDSSETSGKAGTTGITSTRFRKPRVCQVNTRNRCDVPMELVKYAKEEDVDLLVHADCSDFLPPRTFTRLLARHGARLPAPLTRRNLSPDDALASYTSSKQARLEKRHSAQISSIDVQINGQGPSAGVAAAASNGEKEEEEERLARETLRALSARWVLKYTVLIRDRALVADKGYIVAASRYA